ncbi:Protein Y48E1C.4 a [Aphelenchoides avenae]|nr:Protein Y48E1C.4 a [Aphelenchus avenae]
MKRFKDESIVSAWLCVSTCGEGVVPTAKQQVTIRNMQQGLLQRRSARQWVTKPAVDKPAPVPPTREVTPKEVLLQVDYIVENTLRFFFQNASKAPPIDSLVVKDVEFDDRIYGYSFKGLTNLRRHISKMKIYLRYKSAFNRVDHLGSAIYENEDVIVTLYKWKFMESHWASVKALLQRPNYGTKEAVLDLHVNPDGRIYRIVNREATEQDRTDVASMNQIKAERAEAEEREKMKKAEEHWQKENDGLDNRVPDYSATTVRL